VSLLAQLRALDATAGIQHQPGTPTYVIKKATAWTAPQIAAAQTVIDTAPETTPQMRYQRTSREKDILTTLAMIVRAKNLAAWNAMTVQQKKDATFAEAGADEDGHHRRRGDLSVPVALTGIRFERHQCSESALSRAD
jgi:hypothetical protein